MLPEIPKQSLVQDEDGKFWITCKLPFEGHQQAIRVNFADQGRTYSGGKEYLDLGTVRRFEREIKNASDAVSEIALAIRHGSEFSRVSAQKHAIEFMPHQLRPLALFEEQGNREAILIADEVGTGKTYSAGLILHNGLMEGKIGKCLILCPRSIEEKWHSTLRNDFRISCSRARNGRNLVRWLEGETNGIEVLVSSFDKGRATIDDGRLVIERIEDSLKKGEIEDIDLVIIDEIHSTIGRTEGILRRRLVEAASLSSSSRVGLTATPFWRGADDILEISKILRPAIIDEMDVRRMTENQQRFTIAVNSLKREVLSSEDWHDALEGLSELDLGEIEEELPDATQLEPAERIELSLRLGELSPFSSWIVRTRAEEVGRLAERKVPPADLVDLSDDPGAQWYDPDTGTVVNFESESQIISEISGMLEHLNHQLQLSSSPRSFHKHLPKLVQDGIIGEESASRAISLASLLSNSPLDSKEKRLIQVLEDLLKRCRGGVLFTNWQPTFDRLTSTSLNLQGKVPGLKVYAASYSDSEARESEIARFRAHDDPSKWPLLVATRILQEGRDLQDSADCVIHYDLPSNPQAVEQRIGRVDRIGQSSPTVEVRYVLLRDFADHNFLLGMGQKISEFESNVGTMRPILPDGICNTNDFGSVTDEMREQVEKWNLDLIADIDLAGFRDSSIPDGIVSKIPQEISDLSRDRIMQTLEICLPPGSLSLPRGRVDIEPPGANHLAMSPIVESSDYPERVVSELKRCSNDERRAWEIPTNLEGLPIPKNLRRSLLKISIHSVPGGESTLVIADESLQHQAIEIHELTIQHEGVKTTNWIPIRFIDGEAEVVGLSQIARPLMNASEKGSLEDVSRYQSIPSGRALLELRENVLKKSMIVWGRMRLMSDSRRAFSRASWLEAQGVEQQKIDEIRESAQELRKEAEELENYLSLVATCDNRLTILGDVNGIL